MGDGGQKKHHSCEFKKHVIPTYRAAVEHGADVRVVIVRHLLVVGAKEAHGLVVVVLILVVPGHRLVAVIGDVLPAGGAQQPQEGHLDHADGVALCVHVGELRGRRGGGEKLVRLACGGWPTNEKDRLKKD